MTSKQEKQPGIQMVRGPIKYGSIISISHQQDDLAFLHTYGHINKNLYVRTFRNELQEDQNQISTNFTKQMTPNISNFANNQQQQQQNQQIQQQQSQFHQNKKQKEFNRNKQFTQSLFQVFPRLTNAQKNEIIEKKLDINEDIQEEDQIWEDIINENDIKNKIDEQQIKNLQKKLMSEFKDNYETFMKIKGTNICYNHPIQLLHIESCKFLSCHLQQISKIQSQNYALSLQDYTSEATLFKIIPAFNYQKEGDQVVFSNELIMLIRAIPFHNKTTYLNCSDEVSKLEIKDKNKKQSQNQYPSSPNSKISQFANNNTNAQNNQNLNNSNNHNNNQLSQSQLEQDQNLNQKQIEFKNQYISSKGEMGQDPESQHGKKIIKKREANFSLEESCQWKINLFQNYINPQNQYLLCYNVIWLHHSETSSIILADKSKKSQNQNLSIDFANLYHKDNLEIKTGRSKTGDSFTDYSGETFGMWIIENKNFYLGGHVEQFQPYRLKHLASGLYLSVQVKQQQQNKPGYLTNEHTQTIDFDQRNSNNNKNLKTNKNATNNNNNINNNEQNNQIQYQLTLSNFPDETTLFQFEPLQKGNSHDETANYIQGNSFVYLKNIYSNGYIQVVNPYGQSVGAKYKKKQGIQLEPSITKECSDDQLFNIYLSNDSIVWEIKYVMQCFQKLVKLIKLLENSERSEKITHRYLKKLQEKVSSATLILKDLDLFLNNMRNNTSLNGNYGIINHFRQKLLQEQYYIDILFRVLEESLNIDEIISWTKFSELKKFHKKDQDTRSVQTDNRSYIDLRNLSVDSHHINRSNDRISLTGGMHFNKKGSNSAVNDFEYLQFLNYKVQLCYKVYQLLQSLCKNNIKNQEQYYENTYRILTHFRFLPQSVYTTIEILKNNEQLLDKLGANFHVSQIPIIDKKIKDLNLFQYYSNAYQKNIQLQQPNISSQINKNDELQLKSNMFEEKSQKQVGQKQRNQKRSGSYRNEQSQNNQYLIESIKFSKSINLIYFFFKILIDPKSDNNMLLSSYQFLQAVCRFQNDGVSQNQEIIYNLFCYYENEPEGEQIKIPDFFDKQNMLVIDENSQNLIRKQLFFYSDLALARNFLWSQKLNPKFDMNTLLKNVWPRQINEILSESTKIKSQLAKLAMSLYIDHDPLHKQIRPQICRIFRQNNDLVQQNQNFLNNQFVESYKTMIKDIKNYYKQITQLIKQQYIKINNIYKIKDDYIKKKEDKIKKQQAQQIQNELDLSIEIDILYNNELLETTTSLLNLILNLNLIEILNQNQDYKKLINYLLKIMTYTHRSLKFSSNSYLSYANKVHTKKHHQNLELGLANFGNFLTQNVGFSIYNKPVQENEEIEEDETQFSNTKDVDSFQNPLSRGVLMIHNVLQSIHYEDKQIFTSQVNIKMQICDILEQMLDFRQDFLISNIIYWFTEQIAFTQIQNEDQSQDDNEEQQNNIIEKIKTNTRHILPNVSKTGISDIDEKQQQHNEDTGLFGIKKKKTFINFFEQLKNNKNTKNYQKQLEKHKSFIEQQTPKKISSKNTSQLQQNFGKNSGKLDLIQDFIAEDQSDTNLKNQNQIQQKSNLYQINEDQDEEDNQGYNIFQQVIPEFYDLDSWLSTSYKNVPAEKQPIGSVLSQLLTSFMAVQDEELQKRVLKVIIRCFNQRSELVNNIKLLQVIFEEENRNLYIYISKVSNVLKKLIELQEIWLSKFIESEELNLQNIYDQFNKNNDQQENPINYILKILKNLKNGLYSNIKFPNKINSDIEIDISNSQLQIDPQKQKIYNYLRIYESVIDFLKDGMHHFKYVLNEKKIVKQKRDKMKELFSLVFQFLINFCHQNHDNQIKMYQYLNLITSNLQEDIGQIDLICEIFQDNAELVSQIDQNLLEMFADIIIREGRQAKFLNIFMSILKCKDKYVFENQLQVLNMFLPLELKEKEKFLLFLEPNKKKDYFKDNSPQNNRKLKKQSSFNTAINAENEDDLNQDQNHINFDFEEAHNFQNNMTKSYNASEQISLNFKDEPFQYHAKLLDLLIETTYITEQNEYDEVYEDNFDEKYEFNISIAKLRKTFNYSMLLNYLIEEKDDYINDNQFLDPNKTQQSNIISGEPAIDDVIKKQARKKGMSILKPKILDFLRILHVQSEKKQNIQKMDNLQEFRKKLCKFLEKETNLIQSLNGKNINNYQYIDYIFDSLLNFVLCYKKKYIQQQQHDDERIDEKSLHKLSDALSKQIHLFEGKITQRQIDRVEYFVNEYIQTDVYNGERFKVEFEGISNLDFRDPLQKSQNKLPNKIQNKFQGLFKNKQVNLNEKLFKQQVTIQNELIPLRNQSSREDEKNYKITSSLMNSQLEPMSQQQMLQSPITTDAQDIMPILQSQRNSQLQDSPKKTDKQGKKSVLKQKSFRFGNPFQLVGNVTKFITSASQKKEKQIDRQDYKCDKIQEKWNTFVKEFTDENNTQVQQEIQYERHALANALLNINQLIDDERKQDLEFTIDCKSLISKLILLLQSAVSDKKYKDVVLNLLIILIEMVSKNEEEQEKLQNQFNSYGLTTVVLNVICDTETMDSYIFQQLILLLNTLLQGGNINVQETIYKFFITNKKSEKFFQKIYTFIMDEIQKIEQISKQIKNRNRQNSMFSSQISSLFSSDPNLGQIDQDEDNEEKLEEEEKHHLELLQNILSFLQQSVEGHYLPLQKYFKEQTNSINNYDIIFAIIDLIRVFYYDAAIQKYYSVLTQSLETLIEFVQGPCEQNQQAVSESKFLEIAHDLFTNKKKKKKKTGLSSQFFGKQDTNLSSSSSKKKSNVSQNNRIRLEKQAIQNNQEFKGWMIAIIQNKALILILSLIENREIYEKNSIIRIIQRELGLEDVLKKNLRYVYEKYHAIYGNEYRENVFNHLNNDDPIKKFKDYEEIRKNNKIYKNIEPDQYYECIIQNGFYIFFLMLYYVEVETWQNNKPAESLTMELYNKYTYAVINKEYEGFQKVFGDNLLGQLASFAQSLFQTGIGYAQKMKKLTIDQLKQQKNLDEEESQKQKSKRKEEKNKMYIDSFNFFAKNTAQIEVNRNEKIELVFFTKLPFSHFISQEQKRNFQDNVNRSTNKTKVEDLLAVSEDYIKQMKHQENLNHFFSHNPLLALLANYDKLWKDLAFLFTIIINIFILTSFSTKFSTDRLYGYHLFQLEEYNTSRTKRYFQGLGLSMAISSGFVVAFFLVKTLPLIVRKVWKKSQQGLLDKLIRWTINLILIIYQVLQELEVMYYLAYGVFAIFGVTLHPLFFTFHLTEILIRYPTLKNIINSVWYPRVQIGLAFLLFIILEYAFSIIGFLFFRDHFQGNCDEMLICFLFYFDWTFKANGGTSGWITDNSEESSQADYVFGRFVWDTFSNYILVIIMINIVSGIIIDSFGDLRDKEYDKVVDITEKCFICGNDKSDFEKQIYSKGFQKHIRIDHYMWNYIFYIGYLEFKDPNDYMGIESYVHQKLKNDDTSWFPFNKSRDVQSLDDDDIQENEILDQCQDNQIYLNKEMEKIQSLIKNLKNVSEKKKSSEQQLI